MILRTQESRRHAVQTVADSQGLARLMRVSPLFAREVDRGHGLLRDGNLRIEAVLQIARQEQVLGELRELLCAKQGHPNMWPVETFVS